MVGSGVRDIRMSGRIDFFSQTKLDDFFLADRCGFRLFNGGQGAFAGRPRKAQAKFRLQFGQAKGELLAKGGIFFSGAAFRFFHREGFNGTLVF